MNHFFWKWAGRHHSVLACLQFVNLACHSLLSGFEFGIFLTNFYDFVLESDDAGLVLCNLLGKILNGVHERVDGGAFARVPTEQPAAEGGYERYDVADE